jgi:hypothetical protein
MTDAGPPTRGKGSAACTATSSNGFYLNCFAATFRAVTLEPRRHRGREQTRRFIGSIYSWRVGSSPWIWLVVLASGTISDHDILDLTPFFTEDLKTVCGLRAFFFGIKFDFLVANLNPGGRTSFTTLMQEDHPWHEPFWSPPV